MYQWRERTAAPLFTLCSEQLGWAAWVGPLAARLRRTLRPSEIHPEIYPAAAHLPLSSVLSPWCNPNPWCRGGVGLGDAGQRPLSPLPPAQHSPLAELEALEVALCAGGCTSPACECADPPSQVLLAELATMLAELIGMCRAEASRGASSQLGHVAGPLEQQATAFLGALRGAGRSTAR